MIKGTFQFFILLFLGTSVFGQHMPINTQYMYQGLLVNPGITGSKNAMEASLTHRNQWLGNPITPKSTIFSMHSGLKNEILGFGGQIASQSFDELSSVGVTGFVSYGMDLSSRSLNYGHKKVNTSKKRRSKAHSKNRKKYFQNQGNSHHSKKERKLRFGMKFGMVSRSSNWDDIEIYSREDEKFKNVGTEFFPSIGAGAYYFTDQLYLGYSIPEFVNTLESNVSFHPRNWNQTLMAGYSIKATDEIKIVPYFLVRMIGFSRPQPDITTVFKYKNIIDFGLIMRSGFRFVGASMDVMIMQNLQLGYSFDLPTRSDLKFNAIGNHELSLGYTFKKYVKSSSSKFF